MTNDPSPHDVESFIGTLETSYTYDPPERWRHAYDQLRALRPRFQAARAPYAWLSLASLLISLSAAATMFFWAIPSTGQVDYLRFAVLWFVVLFIPLIFDGIAAQLARRHEPLVRYEHQIDSACGKFDKVVAESKNAPA